MVLQEQRNDIMFNNIYKNKKVFLTGHTGFKGSWLALWLTSLGAKVCGYSLAPNTTPSMFEELNIANKIVSEIKDESIEKVEIANPGFINIYLTKKVLLDEIYNNYFAANQVDRLNLKSDLLLKTDKNYVEGQLSFNDYINDSYFS